jgi:signal transduction histidine kinase
MVLQGFAGNISDTQRDFLDKAYSSTERQLHIINDILDLAKLDAGRIVLTKSRFDLVELIKSVADELHDTAQDAGLSPTVSLPSKAPIVGDSHMIRMVVENLMTNAIKYTDSGGKVEVKLIRSGENYLIKVTDSGVGIASKDISKLFAQFTRIPNERSSQVSGTGVGLYLARSLTRLHGGDVEVRSKLGEGSTFTIKIPRGL